MNLTKNFTRQELECSHCKQCNMQPAFLVLLQEYRDKMGISLHINSGYRCEAHNTAIKGSKNSQHILGQAVDIGWQGVDAATKHRMLAIAMTMFNGIGLHKHFLHVDNRTTGKAVWFY